MLKESSSKLNLLSGLRFFKEGVEVSTYLDVGKDTNDEPLSFFFNYPELKEDILTNIIPCKTGITNKEQIEQGSYDLHNSEDVLETLEEVKALRIFAESLEKEMLEKLKDK